MNAIIFYDSTYIVAQLENAPWKGGAPISHSSLLKEGVITEFRSIEVSVRHGGNLTPHGRLSS